VDLAELMGAETYLYLAYDGNNVVARVPAHAKAKAGDKVKIAIDCAKLHIFDAETKIALTE